MVICKSQDATELPTCIKHLNDHIISIRREVICKSQDATELPTCIKHLNDHIISIRREVWVHNTILTLPFLLMCLCQASEPPYTLYMCLIGVTILPVSLIFLIGF